MSRVLNYGLTCGDVLAVRLREARGDRLDRFEFLSHAGDMPNVVRHVMSRGVDQREKCFSRVYYNSMLYIVFVLSILITVEGYHTPGLGLNPSGICCKVPFEDTSPFCEDTRYPNNFLLQVNPRRDFCTICYGNGTSPSSTSPTYFVASTENWCSQSFEYWQSGLVQQACRFFCTASYYTPTSAPTLPTQQPTTAVYKAPCSVELPSDVVGYCCRYTQGYHPINFAGRCEECYAFYRDNEAQWGQHERFIGNESFCYVTLWEEWRNYAEWCPICVRTPSSPVLTLRPSGRPTKAPTMQPSVGVVTFIPSMIPTLLPSKAPSIRISRVPTFLPSAITGSPSMAPSNFPSVISSQPTGNFPSFRIPVEIAVGLVFGPFWMLIASLPLVYARSFGCCAVYLDSNTCVSEFSRSICNETTCVRSCQGLWMNAAPQNFTCSGVFYGKPVFVATLRVPLFLVQSSLGLDSRTGRELLELSRRETGILRTLPIVGPLVAIFTPGYDEDGTSMALEELKKTNIEVQNVARGLSSLSDLLSQAEKARVAADTALAAGIDKNAQDIQLLRVALTAGITSVAKVGIQNQAGISVARAEAAFLDTLGKQERLVQEISVNGLAQKMLKYAMLCDDDPSLCLDISEDSVSFLVTSWMYAWKEVSVGNYRMYGLLSNVTVYRRPSALSYLAPGDAFFYRYTVTPLILGTGTRSVEDSCSGSVQSCSSSYIADCRNVPGCYAATELKGYITPTPARPYGGIESLPGSGPFRSSPYLNAQSNAWGEPGPYDGCGGYSGNYTCCDGICVFECANAGLVRSCDPKLDVIGARPTTVWLPPGITINGIRTMEELGGISVPLRSPIQVGMRTTPIRVNGTFIPYAADFLDPYVIGHRLFRPRIVSMSRRLAELVASANGQDNSALALPGPLVEIDVGAIEGSTVHVVMDPSLFYASAAIIGWATGSAPYVGWIPQTGCAAYEEGICCNSVLPGPVVSSIPFIQQQITSLLPHEYRPRTMYESIFTLQGLADEMNRTLSQISPFNMSERIGFINNITYLIQEGLQEVRSNAEGVAERLEERNEIIQRMIDDVNSRNGGSAGDQLFVVWLFVIMSLLCSLCICGYLIVTKLKVV